nr:putative ribonuclease H-like domain-containing protein [Tanacetum cinerariifolium]
MDKENPWGKDGTREDGDLHLYRSMIGSLMFLTASRPDIMFAVCACARHQVTPKECHLHAVNKIFRYLKGHPKLGLWYPKESPFDLVSFSDSDYGGATQDRKFTTGGCQFLGRRLISWQYKKQKIMATLTTEAEYVAAASCCGQVLWIQNQLLDYGYNFMNTKIYIDNNSAICIVKNPVYHSKTKHIEIRHHYIIDCFEKKLISVDHIHTDDNLADLLTKPFDAGRFQYLVCKLFPLLGKLSTVSVFLGFGLTFAGTFKYWGILRILMIGLRLIPLVSKGYVTMKACCKTCWEKGEHNTDFHLMVDFLEASPLRIETTKEGTKILATVDGFVRTVSESSLRQNLKLRDEEGISSLPDAKLFLNLTLMGYNISPNQKFTFQKGQFSHQWKYLIHTIMQCLSPKSTGFNEFSSNIATALVCLATNRTYNFSKMIFDGLVKNVNNKVSKFLMYPRFLTPCLRMSQFGQITHTQMYVIPFYTKKLFTTLWVNSPSFSGRTVPFFAAMLVHQGEGSGTPTEPHQTSSPEAQTPSHATHPSSSLPPITTISIPTVTPTETTPIRQYTRRTRIAQSSVPLTIADEPASPQRDVSQGEACPTDSDFIADQDKATIDKSSTLPHDSAPWVTSPVAVEGKINRLKEKVKQLEEREGVAATNSKDDAPIKGRSMDEDEAATKRVSDDIEEMETVLTSMDATTVLESGVVNVPTGSGFIPTASTLAEGSVPTGSEKVPTAIPVFATATVVTPVIRRKGKEVMVESETPKKQKIARDAEIVRIHAEEELQSMIDGLDSNNETVAKYLEEYHQFSSELPMERRIELISNLVKDFRGMTFKEVEAKFNSICKQIEDFIPMGSKEEAERIKTKGINLEQESAKKQKSSEEITEEAKSPEEVPEENVKEMMNLVPIEEVYVEALQVKHPVIDWKHLDREDLNQPDKEDQLWTHTQNFMHALVEWKLYDSCGVHHVVAKDKKNLYACGEGLPSEEGSSTCDDLLQTSSRELLTDGK